MNRIVILFSFLLTAQYTFSQTKSCCSAPEQFASLGNDAAFVMKHENPIPFNFQSAVGEMITYSCSDGKDANAFAIKAEIETEKYLFVIHEWWGLNDYIKQMAEQLYNDLGKKVNVIALDLYDGRIAADPKDARSFMQGLIQARANAIINGAIDRVGTDAEIATIGWCMGGGYSLQTSLLAAEKGIGCVMYYGFPESDIERLKTLHADVLMVWPNEDKWITKEVVDEFKANMIAAGKQLTVKEFTADHAFANPSNPKYNVEAASEAYSFTLDFLKSKLL